MRACRHLAALALSLAAVPRLAAADPLPPDLALVPADAAGFAAVRVADLWNSDGAAPLRKMVADNKEMTKNLDDLHTTTGLAPGDVARLVLIAPAPGVGGPLTVVTTVKPYDKMKLLAALGPGAREMKAGGKTYHVAEKRGQALSFASPTTFIFGEPKRVEALLSGPEMKPDGALAEALGRAAGKDAVVVGVDLAVTGKEMKKYAAPDAPLLPLLEARSATATLSAGKDGLTAHVRFLFATEAAARDGEKAGAAAVEMARKEIAKGIEEMGGKKPRNDEEKAILDLMLQAMKEVETALKTAKVERAGNVVQGTLRSPSFAPASAVVFTTWFLFAPRSSPKPPPPRDAPRKDAPGGR
jgi:hypothetical protein